MKIFKISLFILFLNLPIYLKAQTPENKVIKKGIETVLIYKKGWQLSFPVINLTNKDEKIILSFDELGSEINDYSWIIKYCNINWTESELDPIDYINGFSEGSITDYTQSKNTKVNYINYKISFPNEDLEFIKSGNYKIIIYENGNPDDIVLTRGFYVIDNKTQLSGNIFKQSVVKANNNQTVNFSIKYSSDIINPIENIESIIIKNGESKKSTKGIVPSRFTTNEIAFEHKEELSFAGANEYRHFDIKSLKFLSDKLKKIENSDKYYKVLLRPDETLADKKYNYKADLNGKRFIKLENNNQSDFEADYCMLTFRLSMPLNINNGNYYVYGALSDWKLKSTFKMHYNEQGFYEAAIFLKQGYYNYRYVFKSNVKNIDRNAQYLSAEGNFYQTENDYYILCYYKNPIEMCDQLIGFLKINTEK